MDSLLQTLKTLESDLSDPGLYEADGKAKLKDLLSKQASANAQLEAVESEWLSVSETVELMEAELAE
jgi:ATP-binding cassette subfamily F protein 3